MSSIGNHARLGLECGETLDVRSFEAVDRMSQLFEVRIVAVSKNLDLDFDEVIGKEATFTLDAPAPQGGSLSLAGLTRIWKGVAVAADQTRIDAQGLATYEITIAPKAHLLGLRTNYRIFQYKSELDIVIQLLGEWGIEHRVLADAGSHKPRKYKVQYGESDLGFMTRMLEDAGVAYWFDGADGQSTLVLDDRPCSRDVANPALHFRDQPGVVDGEVATALSLVERVRPAKRTIGDLDYRRAPTQQPVLSVANGRPQEAQLEQYDYEPGAFLFAGGGGGGGTPTADDRGTTRTDESQGNALTKSRHLGARSDAQRLRLTSNVIAIGPGSLFGVIDHPHPTVGATTFLTVASRIAGEHSSEWRVEAEGASSDVPYYPPRVTPKPFVDGLDSATVVGPAADEIHTDEFGRVRVHFHWDREGKRSDESSCWLPTNQPWAGASFGGTVLPRIGQEVLVEYLGGDPDRPVVIGRVYTEKQPAPYPLPSGKKLTGLVGRTTPQLMMGGAVDLIQGLPITEQFGSPASSFGKTMPQFAARRPEDFPFSNRDNAFLMDDTQHKNLVYLQAKKDLNFLVKHGWRTVVGNYRGCLIDGNDNLYVRNKQFINVLGDQALAVIKDQSITVVHERKETLLKDVALYSHKDNSIGTTGPLNLTSKTKAITVKADESIALVVGNSMIHITKEQVIVDSPRVDVNP